MGKYLQPIDPTNKTSVAITEAVDDYMDRRARNRRGNVAGAFQAAGQSLAGGIYIDPDSLSRKDAAEMAVVGAQVHRDLASIKADIELEGMTMNRRKLTNLANLVNSTTNLLVAQINSSAEYAGRVNQERMKNSQVASDRAWTVLQTEGWAYNKKLASTPVIAKQKAMVDIFAKQLPVNDAGAYFLPPVTEKLYTDLSRQWADIITANDDVLNADWLNRMEKAYPGMSPEVISGVVGTGKEISETRRLKRQFEQAQKFRERAEDIDERYKEEWERYTRLATDVTGILDMRSDIVPMLNSLMEGIDTPLGEDVQIGGKVGFGELQSDLDPAMEAADALMEAFLDPNAPGPIKQLKAGIIASPDFRTWANDQGYTNDDLAFKYLIQDRRKELRETAKDTRAARKEGLGEPIPEEAIPTEGRRGEGLGSALMTAGAKFFGGKRADARAKALGLDPEAAMEPTEGEVADETPGVEDEGPTTWSDGWAEYTLSDGGNLITYTNPDTNKEVSVRRGDKFWDSIMAKRPEPEVPEEPVSPEQEERQAEEIIGKHGRVGAGTDPWRDGASFEPIRGGHTYEWRPGDQSFYNTDTKTIIDTKDPDQEDAARNLRSAFEKAIKEDRVETTRAQTYLTDVDEPLDEVDKAEMAETVRPEGEPGVTQREKKGIPWGTKTRMGPDDVDQMSQWEVWKALDDRGLLKDHEKAQAGLEREEVGGPEGTWLEKTKTLGQALRKNQVDEGAFGPARSRLKKALSTEVGAGEQKRLFGSRRYEEKRIEGKLKGYKEKQLGREETRRGSAIPLSENERNRMVADVVLQVEEATGVKAFGEGIDTEEELAKPQWEATQHTWADALLDGIEGQLGESGWEVVRGQAGVGPKQVNGDDLDKLRELSRDESLTWQHVEQMGLRTDPTGEGELEDPEEKRLGYIPEEGIEMGEPKIDVEEEPPPGGWKRAMGGRALGEEDPDLQSRLQRAKASAVEAAAAEPGILSETQKQTMGMETEVEKALKRKKAEDEFAAGGGWGA